MKREPYILKENMSVTEIEKLISRSYAEGYEDGRADGAVNIDWEKYINVSPAYIPGTTPYNPAFPNVVYCSSEDELKTKLKTKLSGVDCNA